MVQMQGTKAFHDSSITLALHTAQLNYLSGLDDTKACNKKNMS
jgi:hypothetical protein